MIGAGRIADLANLLNQVSPTARPIIISDETVSALLPDALPGVPRLTFVPGEASKSRDTWTVLTDRIIAAGVGRDALIVAVGGGVTTDLAGFVAATTMRGVPWVAVPTTTVAMLDAALGGKTGVDTLAGKNLVGAFHPPALVLCDPELLATLSDRDYREGLAEALKHALIADAGLRDWLMENFHAVNARDAQALVHLVRTSLAIKARVVESDERETGVRAVLNLGHTIGHALEHGSGYRLTHGEAVAIGMVLETRIAETLGIADPGTTDQVLALVTRFDLPTAASPGLDRELVFSALRNDKKNRAGHVRAALLRRVGEVAQAADGGWTHPLTVDQVSKAIGVSHTED